MGLSKSPHFFEQLCSHTKGTLMHLLSNKPLINVDFDGVVVPNTLEETIPVYAEGMSLGYHDSSALWTWYNELVRNNPLVLNDALLKRLSELKNDYYIHLWTNRSYTLEKYTKDNLGVFSNVFDDFHFNSGRKINTKREGLIIDNDARYAVCGEHFIHYTY